MINPTAAMLVIGDEILSGRTQDTNTHHLAGELTAHGIDLLEVRVVPDDTGAIIAAVQYLAERHNHLFTSGGIGPTHDDITSDAVAAAFDTPIDVRDDARAVLTAHYATTHTKLNAARLRMARVPDGAILIDNPISAAPGFSLKNVHVMAGVPMIFQAMLASLLPSLSGGKPLLSQTLRLMHAEGVIAKPLGELAAQYPEVSFGSYPFYTDSTFGTNIVSRCTDADMLDTVMTELTNMFPTETT